MNKSIKYILTGLICFLTFSSHVSAKEIETKCYYDVTHNNEKYVVNCEFYTNNSYDCVITDSKGNNDPFGEKFQKKYDNAKIGYTAINDVETWYSENKKCVPAVTLYDDGGWDLTAWPSIGDANKYKDYLKNAGKSSGYWQDVVSATSRENSSTEQCKYSFNFENGATNYNFEATVTYDLNTNEITTSVTNMSALTSNSVEFTVSDFLVSSSEKGKSEFKCLAKDKVIAQSCGYTNSPNLPKRIFKIGKAGKDLGCGNESYFYADGAKVKSDSDDNDATPVDPKESETSEDEYNSLAKSCVSCAGFNNIPEQLPMFSRNLLKNLQLLVPILLILFGMFDFLKATMSNDEKLAKESKSKFIRRIVAGILIYIVIAIVKFGFGLIPGKSTLGCIPCFTTDKESCGTPYTCNMYDASTNLDNMK